MSRRDLICRIIVDSQPESGDFNMAADATLLHCAVLKPAGPVVRLYRWKQPTISVGYFQKHLPAKLPSRLAECPCVRRLTGGGAILHHHEITYSCVVPANHPAASPPLALYDLMHGAIRDCLTECGAHVGSRADFPDSKSPPARPDVQPFLCFLRSDPRDLVADVAGCRLKPKIVGSAQRRRKGTILQHGSILLRASPVTSSIPGVWGLFPDFDEQSFAAILSGRLAGVLSRNTEMTQYSDPETEFMFDYLKTRGQNSDGRASPSFR